MVCSQYRCNNLQFHLRIRLRTSSIVPVPLLDLPNIYLPENPRTPENCLFQMIRSELFLVIVMSFAKRARKFISSASRKTVSLNNSIVSIKEADVLHKVRKTLNHGYRNFTNERRVDNLSDKITCEIFFSNYKQPFLNSYSSFLLYFHSFLHAWVNSLIPNIPYFSIIWHLFVSFNEKELAAAVRSYLFLQWYRFRR